MKATEPGDRERAQRARRLEYLLELGREARREGLIEGWRAPVIEMPKRAENSGGI